VPVVTKPAIGMKAMAATTPAVPVTPLSLNTPSSGFADRRCAARAHDPR
jgi:hypothetical protein